SPSELYSLSLHDALPIFDRLAGEGLDDDARTGLARRALPRSAGTASGDDGVLEHSVAAGNDGLLVGGVECRAAILVAEDDLVESRHQQRLRGIGSPFAQTVVEVRRVEAVDFADLRAHDLSGVDAVLYGPPDRGLRQSGPPCRIVDGHRSVAEDIASHPFAQPRLGVEFC